MWTGKANSEAEFVEEDVVSQKDESFRNRIFLGAFKLWDFTFPFCSGLKARAKNQVKKCKS